MSTPDAAVEPVNDQDEAKASKEKDAFVKQLIERYPHVGLTLGWASAISVLLGYAASAVGHIGKIQQALFESLGPEHIQWLHTAMWLLAFLLLSVGYALAAVWAHRHFLSRQRSRTKRLAWLVALCTGFIAIVGASAYAAIPAAPDTDKLLREVAENWTKDLLGAQNPDGGLRWSKVDRTVESQVWTTAQVLVAVLSSDRGIGAGDAVVIRRAFDFIDKAELKEPGQGWGYFEYVPWGATEINAWVTLARAKAYGHPARAELLGPEPAARDRLLHGVELLTTRAMPDGGWAPIKQTDNPRFARTYSTLMVTWALIEARHALADLGRDEYIKGGITWLLAHQSAAWGGWVPNPDRKAQLESFPGLTAHVIYVLLQAPSDFQYLLVEKSFPEVLTEFSRWLAGGEVPLAQYTMASRPVSSNDRSHDSDRYLPRSMFMVESSTFLWYPWTLNACLALAGGAALRLDVAEFNGCQLLDGRINDLVVFARDEPSSYVTAESLFALNNHLAAARRP